MQTFYFRVHGSMVNTLSVYLYLLQKTAYAALFITWLSIKVDPSNIAASTGNAIVCVGIIFFFCFLNETFKQKVTYKPFFKNFF